MMVWRLTSIKYLFFRWLRYILWNHTYQDQIYTADWGNTLDVAGLTLSMTVNALVTAYRINRVQESSSYSGKSRLVPRRTAGFQPAGAHFTVSYFRYGFVFNPIGSACGYKYDHVKLCCQWWYLFPAHEMLNVIIRSVIAMLFYWQHEPLLVGLYTVWFWRSTARINRTELYTVSVAPLTTAVGVII